MNKNQNILGFLLLSTYFLVLLHGFVPHFHGESECVVNKATHHHNTHHHHEGEHHHHNSEEGLLHALGHIFNGFHHLDMGEEHLTHLSTKVAKFKFQTLAIFIGNDIMHLIQSRLTKEGQRKDYCAYAAPPIGTEQYRTLPFRGPPALT